MQAASFSLPRLLVGLETGTFLPAPGRARGFEHIPVASLIQSFFLKKKKKRVEA